jgi:hypothetical protein
MEEEPLGTLFHTGSGAVKMPVHTELTVCTVYGSLLLLVPITAEHFDFW